MHPKNKRHRTLLAAFVLSRRISDLGLSCPDPLSPEGKRSIAAGGYRISDHDDRKRFHKSRCYYGHFSGSCKKGHSKRQLLERLSNLSLPTHLT